MAQHTTISLQNDTLKLLDEYKKNNPDFNLSGFLNNKIKEYLENPNALLSIETIDKEINLMKLQINTCLNEIDLFIDKKFEFKVKEELNKQEEIIKKQKEVEKLGFKKKMINDFFKGEMNRDMTDEEFNEYSGKIEGGIIQNIFDYIKILKDKPIFKKIDEKEVTEE